jgi:serine/threonine-protein kinase
VSQNPDGGTKLEEGATVTLTVSKGPPLVTIPNVAGQAEADARQTLESLGFKVKSKDEFSTDVPRGQVIQTDPAAGKKLPKGETVTMIVSKGPETFAMPDVVGMSREDARQTLESLGLVVKIVELPNPDPPDTVVFQDPSAGETVEQGQEVTLYVTQPS